MICVAVTYLIRPGEEERAVEFLRTMTGLTRAEPGCRMYQAHRSTTNPRQFFLYEQYDDLAAVDVHRASPHFVEHVKNGLFTILETRSPEFYEPITD